MMAPATESPRAILVLGNANLDVIVGHVDTWPERGTESFFPHGDLRIGGSAANTARVLQRLGARSGLVSAHGSDFAGAAIGQAFSGARDRVASLSGPTGFTVGLLHRPSERTFLSSVGHLDRLDAGFFRRALDGVALEGALVLLSGGFAMPALIEGHRALQDFLRDRGAELAIDPGWPDGDWTDTELRQARAWLAASDHALLNDKEAAAIAGTGDLEAMIGALADAMPSGTTLVIKRGPRGAIAHRAGRTIEVTAQALDPVDTVGAGDAFNAGYLDARAKGMSLRACLERAVTVAGHIVSEFPRAASPIDLARQSEPA
ncbi:MAG: carbohydrate kinase family protein [Roseitalea porphyridii]|uniref:carbohydrate kinase family protein n=1 Tax=Roseitalea porphyridii TaxID=1852022 RepID=UPI0032D8F364